MDIATTDSLKEELINRDPEFRELAREHHKYEERLSELSALNYPWLRCPFSCISPFNLSDGAGRMVGGR